MMKSTRYAATFLFFFFNDPATPEIYPLPQHDPLPICPQALPPTLDELEHEGLLSAPRFAESLLNRRAARYGTARIMGELKRHALDPHLVQTLHQQIGRAHV